MDIIFVLEWSGTSDDQNSMCDFLLSIGKRLKIGEQDGKGEVIGRGAIITYDKEGKMRITLHESQNKGSFARVVKTMSDPIASNQTKSRRDLDVGSESAIINSIGYRENVSKLLVVMPNETKTSGFEQNGYKKGREIVQRLIQSADVKTVAVAIGTTKKNYIEHIKNTVKDKNDAIILKNYRELNQTSVEDFIFDKILP